ncbi:nucleotidyl transferase AbiEii/AbiGii toxin family protein [Kumtagia ephedrae]|uniref:nucleotidyl transferase AbiEii/AbiGii toxin family protein n=1 Tax=Kumtagia ephedrae TaxID=2116701 RepID=UPI001FE004A3|nr:nucleotidyl transferase AbiEii/AbiGii toxin family protein [Mesorhizobium ephedrae]
MSILCADTNGYREIRNSVVGGGTRKLFGEDVVSVREPRADAYGIRMFLEQAGQPIKFEIIREARITLSGALDDRLGVPVLGLVDMFAEKLLANADRCMDRSAAYRDAVDLGRLVEAHGRIPAESLEKAMHAYGADIERKAVWVVNDYAKMEDCARLLRHCRWTWPWRPAPWRHFEPNAAASGRLAPSKADPPRRSEDRPRLVFTQP